MCYSVFLSTDSNEDLSKRNSQLLKFGKIKDADFDFCKKVLNYPNWWYVASESGCSCTFRHLAAGNEMEFSQPQDWCKEEPNEINATKQLYRVLKSILLSGFKVDLVDKWEGQNAEDIKTIDMSFNEVQEIEFRLFETHKFNSKNL